jgi:hypothetical protein
MLWSRPTVPDDRGRRVELFTPAKSSASEDPELFATVGRVYESATLLHERVRLVHVLYLVAGFAVVVLVAIFAQRLTWLPPGVTGALVAMTWIGLAAFIAMQSRHRYSNRTAESILRIGRCPSCGYRLGGAPVDDDGLIVCPECASAWKQERVGASRVSAADIPAGADVPGDMAPVSWRLKLMWTRLPTIVDDRDRSMSLTDPRLPRLEASVGAVRAADVRRTMSERVGLRKQGWGCAVVLGIVLAASPSIFAFTLTTSSLPRIMACWMAVFWTFGLTRALYRLAKGKSRVLAKPTKIILLEHAVCPSCAADLSGCVPEADGCVVCASCRAAWKLKASEDHGSMRKTTRV